jgi:hypothetical protein
MSNDTSRPSDVQPFTWGDIALSQVVYIDGIPHATKQAIGEWLEYGDPRLAINKLLERNPHIDHYSTEVKLTSVDGKNRDTKVYHPIGFLLIVMESGQPKALACKVAVAEFVWRFAGPKKHTHKELMQLRNQRINILAKLDKASNQFVRNALLGDLQAVSLTIGIDVPDVLLLNNANPKQGKLEV